MWMIPQRVKNRFESFFNYLINFLTMMIDVKVASHIVVPASRLARPPRSSTGETRVSDST